MLIRKGGNMSRQRFFETVMTTMSFSLTPEQKELIKAWAKAKNMGVSEFLRWKLGFSREEERDE